MHRSRVIIEILADPIAENPVHEAHRIAETMANWATGNIEGVDEVRVIKILSCEKEDDIQYV